MVACAPTACKHRVSGSLSLPSRGAFHLSLTVLFAIGHQVVFSLGGWSPRLPTGFLVSCGTLDTGRISITSPTGLLPCLVLLSSNLPLVISIFTPVRTPGVRRLPVWALSRSLAATQEIVVTFSSSGYLDVSVHRVPSVALCIHCTVHTHYRMRVSPFGHLRINGYVRLPAAYRSLSRPSSAPVAKAFTLCSYLLDHF